ncbi:hypothetical protein NLM59_11025 [Weeksellaceae bacterium KMM 9724]|uniref:hypothetical protein n=1 Tax=Profundicola chukchiensis TaxID=2961959 RepID=UPI00243B7C56|nr:hypothetical protein [Profundicola chukchiensis]MDG4951454.1 hypothetical protein [Profundicola chukchiensis]
MNSQILNLFHNPLSISSQDLFQIEDEIEKYPYFQALQLLKAKAVSTSDEETLTSVLNKTATFCSNRSILFEYIHTETQEKVVEEETAKEEIDLEEVDSEANIQDVIKQKSQEETSAEKEIVDDKQEEIESLIKAHEKVYPKVEEEKIIEPTKPEDKEETTTAETAKSNLSFSQWLKSSHRTPEETEEVAKETDVVNEKFKVIEEFLDKNPKITPSKEYKPSIEIQSTNKENLSHLMTETLAKIYVEQNKFDKAIKAYTILRLKYPEKSGYFADQIKEIQELKHK